MGAARKAKLLAVRRVGLAAQHFGSGGAVHVAGGQEALMVGFVLGRGGVDADTRDVFAFLVEQKPTRDVQSRVPGRQRGHLGGGEEFGLLLRGGGVYGDQHTTVW